MSAKIELLKCVINEEDKDLDWISQPQEEKQQIVDEQIEVPEALQTSASSSIQSEDYHILKVYKKYNMEDKKKESMKKYYLMKRSLFANQERSYIKSMQEKLLLQSTMKDYKKRKEMQRKRVEDNIVTPTDLKEIEPEIQLLSTATIENSVHTEKRYMDALCHVISTKISKGQSGKSICACVGDSCAVNCPLYNNRKGKCFLHILM
jgi:hypothetical protein